MSNTQYDPARKAAQSGPQHAPVQGPGTSRMLPVLGVVLGLLGLAVGVAAWFRAAGPPDGVANTEYTEQQADEAKKAICDTYELGLRAVRAAGTRKPDNPAEAIPVTAVNIRLAEATVGNSFFNVLSANPAAPTELADQVNRLSEIYQKLALIHLSDGSRDEFYPIAAQADQLIPQIDQACQ